MGSRGPVGKRHDQRLSHSRGIQEKPTTIAPAGRAPEPPPEDLKWHAVARRFYRSLGESGQAQFYEASDWATAYLVTEALSRWLKPRYLGHDDTGKPIVRTVPLAGSELTAFQRACTELLVTEGSRRRVHLELQRPSSEPDAAALAAVDRLDDVRARLERDN